MVLIVSVPGIAFSFDSTRINNIQQFGVGNIFANMREDVACICNPQRHRSAVHPSRLIRTIVVRCLNSITVMILSFRTDRSGQTV